MSLVLITGGAKRLGKGLAVEFAKNGWDVGFCYNKSENESETTLNELLQYDISVNKFKCDVTNYQDVETKFKVFFDKYGKPDVLINNAGVYPQAKSLTETTPELWKFVIDSNLTSQFNTAKVYSELTETGRIVNIGSLGAFEIWNGRIPYNVSKAAVIQLTKALARELAPRFSVNCVCPGEIKMDESGPDESWSLPNEKIPMNRKAYVEDIFDAVYFFSNESKYITGQYLIIDGGYHLAR